MRANAALRQRAHLHHRWIIRVFQQHAADAVLPQAPELAALRRIGLAGEDELQQRALARVAVERAVFAVPID